MKKDIVKNLALISQIGIIMVVNIGICLYIGKYLDDAIGTKYLFLLIFTVLGVMSAFLNIYKLIMSSFEK